MAGFVGGVACSRVVGFARPQAERAQVWQVAGVDGYGIHLMGKGDSQNQFRLVYYGTTASCNAWYIGIRNLQGSILQIINEQGETFANQFVQSVGAPQRQTANDLSSTTTRFEVQIQTITV